MPTACFTGHRALNGVYYDHANPHPNWTILRNYLNTNVRSLIAHQDVSRFISGMAIGVDQLAAEVVIQVRTEYPGITLVGALPFPSQAANWPYQVRQHWSDLLNAANSYHAVSDNPYTPQKMQVRNEWMVNESDYVLAVWNGIQQGGTWNCITYARSQDKPVYTLQPMGAAWGGAWLEEV